jgi:hypothetical protein
MNVPYAIQIAFGWTSLPFWLNIIYIATLVPTILWATIKYGAIGAAAVWLLLNILCLLVVPQLMHRIVLRGEKFEWYLNAFLIPILVSVPLAMLFQVFQIGTKWEVVLSIFMSWAMLSIALVLVLPRTRRIALQLASNYLKHSR